MNYEIKEIRKAMSLFLELITNGFLEKESYQIYFDNSDIQLLIENFADEAETFLIPSGEKIYLVPNSPFSPFHLKNEQIRKELGSNMQNIDVYTMYFCLLVFIGEFYNSFTSISMQRNFLNLADWLAAVNQRIDSLRNHGESILAQAEKMLSYNWLGIIERWDSWNDLKETSANQKGNTVSRINFLYRTVQFMENKGIIELVGQDEYKPTEKCQIIVQRYFMETEYNRNIIRFMYRKDEE